MVLVSAVITSHKRKPEIVERALKSVLSQTYKNVEIIVVDDSPSDYEHRDAVRQMVEKYGSQGVTYIQHMASSGACVARNTGLALSKGEFIGFLDDDDEWCPKKVEMFLGGFDEADVALVYGNHIGKNDETGEYTEIKNPAYFGYVFDELIMVNFIGSTSFPLIRTSALREVGGFDPEQPAGQDMDLWLRLAQKYKVNYIDESLNIYHWHAGEQITKASNRRVKGMERLMEKHCEYLRTHKKAYWMRLLRIIPDYANNKQYVKAFVTWFKAVFMRPLSVNVNFSYLVLLAKNVVRNIFLK